MKKAFTLIELLIVVAIIAILAAIAVPNFLEAQVRSKVSRVKADLRTEATGMESYIVDNNAYPPCNSFGTALYNGVSGGPSLEFLSTPIAYLTSALTKDVFKVANRLTGATAAAIQTATPVAVLPTDQAAIQNSYIYQAWSTTQRIQTDAAPAAGDQKARSWLMQSAGPDSTYYNLGGVLATDALPAALQYTIDMMYDPTNGTVSRGSVWRTGGQPGGNALPYVGGTALVAAIHSQR